MTTGGGGVWSFLVRPRIGTVYGARVDGVRTRAVAIGVRPRVGISVRDGAFLVRVVAARSFEGRYLLLQRRAESGAWVLVRRVYVGRPLRRLGVELPPGVSRVRAFLPAGQAGPGYAASLSREVTLRR